MNREYVEYSDDAGYRVAGTRVSLDSIVFAFRQGCSPEMIVRECFPTLTLEQVYGAITYYLAHWSEVDVYLEQAGEEFNALRKATNNPQ